MLVHDGRILRGLGAAGRASWAAADESGLLGRLTAAGALVDHWRLGDEEATALAPGWEAVIEAERLPVVTYPYEWSFEMLRAAALRTLDISIECLDAGFQLKDASAYNILFDGGEPRFIDIGSIEEGYDGLWIGYAQFVSHFLAPLLITSRLGIPFQPLLRAHLEGVPLEVAAAMFHGRQKLGRGVAFHIAYANRVTRRAAALPAARRRGIASEMRVPLAAAKANMTRMAKLIAGLDNPQGSTWADYEDDNSYSDDEAAAKHRFVTSAAAEHGRRVAWDVGANAGHYALALTGLVDTVVGIEPDPGAADRLHQRCRQHQGSGLHAVAMDITDPSPDRGWRLHERRALHHRARPDLALWLAVVHHLCLGRGYPVEEVLDLVAETSPVAVVEYVDPDDPMGQELLASRRATPHEFSRERFLDAVASRFEILADDRLKPTRHLYLLRRRS